MTIQPQPIRPLSILQRFILTLLNQFGTVTLNSLIEDTCANRTSIIKALQDLEARGHIHNVTVPAAEGGRALAREWKEGPAPAPKDADLDGRHTDGSYEAHRKAFPADLFPGEVLTPAPVAVKEPTHSAADVHARISDYNRRFLTVVAVYFHKHGWEVSQTDEHLTATSRFGRKNEVWVVLYHDAPVSVLLVNRGKTLKRRNFLQLDAGEVAQWVEENA